MSNDLYLFARHYAREFSLDPSKEKRQDMEAALVLFWHSLTDDERKNYVEQWKQANPKGKDSLMLMKEFFETRMHKPVQLIDPVEGKLTRATVSALSTWTRTNDPEDEKEWLNAVGEYYDFLTEERRLWVIKRCRELHGPFHNRIPIAEYFEKRMQES